MWFDEKQNAVIVYLADPNTPDETWLPEIPHGVIDLVERIAIGRRLVLDFTGVEFLSSALIGSLVILVARTRQLKVEVKLRNLAPNVLEVFRIGRLHKRFDIGTGDFGED